MNGQILENRLGIPEDPEDAGGLTHGKAIIAPRVLDPAAELPAGPCRGTEG